MWCVATMARVGIIITIIDPKMSSCYKLQFRFNFNTVKGHHCSLTSDVIVRIRESSSDGTCGLIQLYSGLIVHGLSTLASSIGALDTPLGRHYNNACVRDTWKCYACWGTYWRGCCVCSTRTEEDTGVDEARWRGDGGADEEAHWRLSVDGRPAPAPGGERSVTQAASSRHISQAIVSLLSRSFLIHARHLSHVVLCSQWYLSLLCPHSFRAGSCFCNDHQDSFHRVISHNILLRLCPYHRMPRYCWFALFSLFIIRCFWPCQFQRTECLSLLSVWTLILTSLFNLLSAFFRQQVYKTSH